MGTAIIYLGTAVDEIKSSEAVNQTPDVSKDDHPGTSLGLMVDFRKNHWTERLSVVLLPKHCTIS